MKLKARQRDRAKSRAVMARAELRLILIGLAASSLLGACVDGSGDTTRSAGPGLLASPGSKVGSREIEAPEVFQTTDSALWDGRPSLGGIWVASPEVTDPERVVMFNPATGKSVTGALFKRERDNPGPTLQISSDAAEALGILAGQPTEIQVTALRKEEIEVPAEPVAAEAAAEDPATEGATTEATAPDAAAAETAALATAALDAADGVTDGAAAAADGVTPDAAVTEPPKKKTWKERRAEAKAKREAEKAAKAAAAAAAEAGTAVIEGAPLEPVDPAASAVATIETAPLDARAPEAAAKPEAAPTAAEPVAAAPVPAATGSRPIQIASFSKEENAKRAVEALAKIGITAQPQKSGTATKTVWGVVATGDAALLAKIKAAGFADAYFLQ
jgi:rare lipoprotein A